MAEKIKAKELLDQVGRVPPHAPEIEEAVLGALMIVEDAASDYSNLLKPEVFYNEAHQKIYKAIEALVREDEKVDLYTVKEKLLETGELDEVGGMAYLARLTYNVGSAAHLDYYVKILVQKYIQRALIRVSSEIQSRAFDASADVDELLDYSEQQIFELAYGAISREAIPMEALLPKVISELEEASKKEGSLTGVPSGYSSIDRITGGWQKSDLIIVAARPSMGKTAFVVNLAYNLAVEYQEPVAFFTLEMPSQQIAMRLLSIHTEISMNKIRTGKLTEDEWMLLEEKLTDNFAKAPLLIDDTPQLSLFELRAKARRLKSKYDIKLLVIDYLQLMTLPSEGRMNREQVVSQISRGLKAIAKELEIPVIALSQLNRSVEMRGGSKRPQLADLRESGAIEQDADMVIFLHRPEYYGIKEDSEGNPLEGIAEIIISKHRNGPLADIRLKFIKEYGKFEEIEETVLQDLDDMSVVTRLGSRMNEADDAIGDDFFNQSSTGADDTFINPDFDDNAEYPF